MHVRGHLRQDRADGRVPDDQQPGQEMLVAGIGGLAHIRMQYDQIDSMSTGLLSFPLFWAADRIYLKTAAKLTWMASIQNFSEYKARF